MAKKKKRKKISTINEICHQSRNKSPANIDLLGVVGTTGVPGEWRFIVNKALRR